MADYKALYRKWRPFDFDDVCGQKSTTDILKYEVSSGKISHAYLFCGSRGTGKTSCAKILAKAVNCENPRNGNPCNKCESCRSIELGTSTDVIEMDAASNNGVDNVRILKDEISFTPALLKYRVYIIDEVHMMSTQAFNALLKTLEEPPSYVVFILATTEYHKLPTTIVSRCQRFDFRRMTSDVIVSRLEKIANAEGIELLPDGARLIARASRGGMRDAVSLLELCAGSREKIDANLVASTIGTGNRETLYNLTSALSRLDFSVVYKIVDDVVSGSADISVFWQELIDTYRDIMVVKNSSTAKDYLDLTETEFESLKAISESFSMAKLSYHATLLEEALADMQRSQNSKRSVAEIALTRMCDSKLLATPEALAVRIEELEKQISMIKMGAIAKAPVSETAQEPLKPVTKSAFNNASNATVDKEAPKTKAPEAPKTEAVPSGAEPFAFWGEVVERISEFKPPLAAGLKKGEAYTVGEHSYIIKLDAFYVSRLNNSASEMAILKGAIAEKLGIPQQNVRIRIVEADSSSANNASDIENALKF